MYLVTPKQKKNIAKQKRNEQTNKLFIKGNEMVERVVSLLRPLALKNAAFRSSHQPCKGALKERFSKLKNAILKRNY